jgi:hypothetical protein
VRKLRAIRRQRQSTLRALLDDRDWWAHPRDGIAAFAAPGFFRAIHLAHAGPAIPLGPIKGGAGCSP